MTLVCEDVRERLADGESDDAMAAHLAGCASCRALAAALSEVDGELRTLLPIDPPEALVEMTLARVAAVDQSVSEQHAIGHSVIDPTAIEPKANEPKAIDPKAIDRKAMEPKPIEGSSIFAASFGVIVAALVAIVSAPLVLWRALERWVGGLGAPHASAADDRAAPRRGRWIEAAVVMGVAGVVGVAGWQRFGNMVKGKIDGSTSTLDADPYLSEGLGSRSASAGSGWFEAAPAAPPMAMPIEPSTAPRADEPTDEGRFAEDTIAREADRQQIGEQGRLQALVGQSVEGEGAYGGRRLATLHAPSPLHSTLGDDGVETWNGRDDGDGQTGERGEQVTLELRAELAGDLDQANQERLAQGETPEETDGEETDGEALGSELRTRGRERESLRGADAPWSVRNETEGLTFHPRDGWWQSTYVPGDPAMRLLHARLASSSTRLPGLDRTALSFAEDVDALEPMLAAPRDRALAVGAFADTAAIDGPTRVRVEVALRSIAQAAGRRGVLRVAVVIDADAALDADAQARTRAIVNALARSSSPRDQLALYASGGGGGRLAELGPMRAGRFEVALRHLFAGETTSTAGPVAMSNAVTDALEAVAGADGVGLVLVVTPDTANDRATEQAIHLGTLAGITTTAIGVSPSAQLASLDAIALAGQGRRRIVLSDDDATSSVRAELSAASELVARAVRVRMRLAEGVELVDVIGSRPLDAEESRRTRAVEQSIDQDLARRLGILSDRGEDDDGIRMLLPAFYANDAHTIVLDLLVRRPGRVLDVDVTLKDMVRVGNATASASVTLPSGRGAQGPRELRVVADTLVHQNARALASIADALSARDVDGARARLDELRATMRAALARSPELVRQPAFVEDRARLESLAASLDGGADPSLLGEAVRLAAFRRLQRPRLAIAP